MLESIGSTLGDLLAPHGPPVNAAASYTPGDFSVHFFLQLAAILLACRLFGGPRRVLPLLAAEGRLAGRRLIAPAAADPGRDDYLLARLTDRGALLDAMGRLRAAYPNALAIERPALTGHGPGRADGDHRRVRIADLFASFHQETTGVALDAAGRATLERIVEGLELEARHA